MELEGHDALCVRWGSFVDRVKDYIVELFRKKINLHYHSFKVTLAPDLFLPQSAYPDEVDHSIEREIDHLVYAMGIEIWKEIEPYAYMLIYHIGKEVRSELDKTKERNISLSGNSSRYWALLTISFSKSTIFARHSFDEESEEEN